MKKVLFAVIAMIAIGFASCGNKAQAPANGAQDVETAVSEITAALQEHFHFIKGDAEGIVNLPLQIKGQKLSVSLREDTEKENVIWVSLRSVDDFPCNKMAAEFFNGGGHLNASGGRLYCSMAEAEAIVKKAFLAYEDLLKKS